MRCTFILALVFPLMVRGLTIFVVVEKICWRKCTFFFGLEDFGKVVADLTLVFTFVGCVQEWICLFRHKQRLFNCSPDEQNNNVKIVFEITYSNYTVNKLTMKKIFDTQDAHTFICRAKWNGRAQKNNEWNEKLFFEYPLASIYIYKQSECEKRKIR